MKIVLAPDSFKGSLDADEVCAAMADYLMLSGPIALYIRKSGICSRQIKKLPRKSLCITLRNSQLFWTNKLIRPHQHQYAPGGLYNPIKGY